MIEIPQILFRLFLAAILGGLFGMEREHKHKDAGLRTNMMVSLGSASAMILSLAFEIDPARIASGVITGIGFLGAGVIMQSRGEVHGITTAATIWVVSSIGMAAGYGYYSLALATSLIGIAVLYLLGLPKVREIAETND